MAILDILEFPDPRLRTKAKPVDKITAEIQDLARDMLETMYEAPGIGLAATQVNVHKRILVIDVSEEKDQPKIYINPVITPLTEIEQEYAEGCLSVPGFYEEINRPEKVRVEALDLEGNSFTEECEGLLAVCIQHELDHLEGKLFVDYISGLKRQRIKKKLLKEQKARA